MPCRPTGTRYTAFLTINNFSIVDAGIISVLLPVILSQTIDGVGLNLAWMNFPYLNTPKHDQTYYSSFYPLLISIMAFLGQLTATLFPDAWGSRTVLFLRYPLSAVQLLLVIQACIDLTCVIVIFTCLKYLQPDPEV